MRSTLKYRLMCIDKNIKKFEAVRDHCFDCEDRKRAIQAIKEIKMVKKNIKTKKHKEFGVADEYYHSLTYHSKSEILYILDKTHNKDLIQKLNDIEDEFVDIFYEIQQKRLQTKVENNERN